MKKFASVCLILCLLTSVSQAAEKTAIPKADADGWITLFNGKDLTGWEGIEGGYWSVVDGAIQGSEQKETSKHTHLILLCSKDNPEKFANFELRYSWRMITKGGNSGVQFRGKIDNPKMYHVGGYQADIDANNSFTGIIYDEGGVAGKRGIMSRRGEKTLWDENNKRSGTPLPKNNAEIKKDIKPIGQWNNNVIKAEGNHIVTTINGTVTTELIDNSPKALKNGVIGLQMHGGHTMTIQFKDIRIKMLP